MNLNIIPVTRLPRLSKTAIKNCRRSQFIFFCLANLCISLLFPSSGRGQGSLATGEGESAICEIKLIDKTAMDLPNKTEINLNASGAKKKKKGKLKPLEICLEKAAFKTVKPGLNEAGYFETVYNIQPNQKLPVVVSYPDGNPGEKVAILVQDGGNLDNGEKAKVVQLDAQNKIAFNFQVNSNSGLFRVMLRKGSDAKIIQLWVGSEQIPVKK